MTTKETYDQGYNQAKADCLKLLAKWFWASAPETKSCRAEMQALQSQPPK